MMHNDAGMATSDKDTKRVTVTLDGKVFDGLEALAKANRDSLAGTVNRLMAAALHQNSNDRLVTLDSDVIAAIEGVSKAQRDSFSGMTNRMLATMLGLIPRQADRAKDAEGEKT